MKKRFLSLASLAVCGLLYAWPPSHDFLVSRDFSSAAVNFVLPAMLLTFGWLHIRKGMSSLNLAALKAHASLLFLWGIFYALNHHVSSLPQFLHTAWPVPFTVVYYAALAMAVPLAQWRRRHPRPGGALQRYQQEQPLQPRGSTLPVTASAAPLVQSASYPVRNSRFDQFVDLSQAELMDTAKNHRGPMRVYYEHVRGEDGEEYMISRTEVGNDGHR